MAFDELFLRRLSGERYLEALKGDLASWRVLRGRWSDMLSGMGGPVGTERTLRAQKGVTTCEREIERLEALLGSHCG